MASASPHPCFCPCHEYPGVYPRPFCGSCGHHADRGRFVGTVRDGWWPDPPRVLAPEQWPYPVDYLAECEQIMERIGTELDRRTTLMRQVQGWPAGPLQALYILLDCVERGRLQGSPQ